MSFDQRFETPVFKLSELEPGILNIQFKPAAVLDLAGAQALVKMCIEVTGGRSCLCLADIRELSRVEPEARSFMAGQLSGVFEATAAVSDSAWAQALVKIYVAVNRPPRPVRLFATEREALVWLRSHRGHPDSTQGTEAGSILDVLAGFAALDFSRKVVTSPGADPERAAVAEAVNLLGEELMHSTLSRSRFEKILGATHAVFYSGVAASGSRGQFVLKFIGPNRDALGLGAVDWSRLLAEWVDQIHPEDREDYRRARGHLLAFGRAEALYRLRGEGEQYAWLRDTMSLIDDEIVGFWSNVDAEVLSRERAELFSRVLDRVSIVAMTDTKGKITHVNEFFCEISGYSREELVGNDHRILNSGLHSKEFMGQLWRTILSGRIWRGELRNRRKDGTHYWVDTVIAPIVGAGGKCMGYLSVRFDITSKKKTEASLLHASKLASLGEMSAGIAHEINNPLTVILGRGRQALRMVSENESHELDLAKLKTDLETTIRAAERIQKIVKGLRVFSRQDDSQEPPALVPLKSLLSETASLFAERVRGTDLEFTVEETPDVLVECRPVQIGQILINLLNNAYDAVHAESEPWIRLSSRVVSGGLLHVRVADSGPGIPAEIRAKMMQPFFTTKPVGIGTGLGLSISLGIAQEHGGRIWIDDGEPNTVLVLELPLRQSGSVRAAS